MDGCWIIVIIAVPLIILVPIYILIITIGAKKSSETLPLISK